MMGGLYAGDVAPEQAWEMLEGDGDALLIDVRTTAEFAYVGVPDVSRLGREPLFICWQLFPMMQINPEFVDLVEQHATEKDQTLLFICRSGVRSRHAAQALTARGHSNCYNIACGFEGDRDHSGHRGTVNGWKVAGLPWVQG